MRGTCISGSVLNRHEGRTVDGEPLPNVLWVSFARHAGVEFRDRFILGSVQFIGYDTETGATAFFESNDAVEPWVHYDPETDRMTGVMPWIDDPEEFSKAFVTPGKGQCVECHQNDPFIHNSFIDSAKLPGTDEPVVPRLPDLSSDPPYYVIGGDDWDMRVMHIEGNGCYDCHRVGTITMKLFMSNGWHPNEHMPPGDPGSMEEDFKELVAAWRNKPHNTPGAEWVIPPARGEDRKVVGDEYPHKWKGRRVFSEESAHTVKFVEGEPAKPDADKSESKKADPYDKDKKGKGGDTD